MTVTYCDICEEKIIGKSIRVTVGCGEHPHAGSRMTKLIDCCRNCACEIVNLTCETDFDELKLIKK